MYGLCGKLKAKVDTPERGRLAVSENMAANSQHGDFTGALRTRNSVESTAEGMFSFCKDFILTGQVHFIGRVVCRVDLPGDSPTPPC
jgi:hypothetical protein